MLRVVVLIKGIVMKSMANETIRYAKVINKRSTIVFLVSAALLGIGMKPASASCLTSDVAGTWLMSGLQIGSEEFFDTHLHCKIVFSSLGYISTSSSVCYDSGGNSLYFSGGKFDVYTTCGTQGYLDTYNTINYQTTRTYVGGQISQEKNAWNGAGVTVGNFSQSSLHISGYKQ